MASFFYGASMRPEYNGPVLDPRDLRARREAVRLTQPELAKRCGVSKQHVWAVETGRADGSMAFLRRAEAVIEEEARRLVSSLGTENGPGATSGSPEPGIVALLDDAAIAAGLGLTADERTALLELRLGGRITSAQEALAFVGPVLALLRRA